MVGANLTEIGDGNAIRVELAGGEDTSGLAEMLHQFIEQTLADSPRKVRLARRLHGDLVFHAAEDATVRVHTTFAGDRIELRDCGAAQMAGKPAASITADFLTVAHLTSGQENPFVLLARRKLQVRFSLLQLPFLLGALRFMQIDNAARRKGQRAALVRWAIGAAGVAGAVYWYATTHL